MQARMQPRNTLHKSLIHHTTKAGKSEDRTWIAASRSVIDEYTRKIFISKCDRADEEFGQ
jgi:hypothetical protein